MPTRRTVLRKSGLVGAGTLAGVFALPAPRDTPELEHPYTVEGRARNGEPPDPIAPWLETDAPIADEDDAPVARYQYRPLEDGIVGNGIDVGDRDGFVATSPINVVLVPDEDRVGDGDEDENERTLERVMAVLEDAGWLREPEEYTRYAWDRTAERYVRQQATAAETYYGTSGRFHVRCWAFEGVVSMQVHQDTAARPKHGLASYERGRGAVAALYTATGWGVVGAIELDNAGPPDHDGRATVLAEPTPTADSEPAATIRSPEIRSPEGRP